MVMMLRILVLQRLYNLSDKVPDAKTVRKFKNDLAETEKVTIKAKFLFQSFAYGSRFDRLCSIPLFV